MSKNLKPGSVASLVCVPTQLQAPPRAPREARGTEEKEALLLGGPHSLFSISSKPQDSRPSF